VPTYRYKCPSCASEFDVTKSVNNIDSLENCETCGRANIEGNARILGRCYFCGEKADDPFYSQALGKVVSSKKAQSAEAKRRGWEELGTTDIDKHIDRTDRHREEKIQGRWDELIRG